MKTKTIIFALLMIAILALAGCNSKKASEEAKVVDVEVETTDSTEPAPQPETPPQQPVPEPETPQEPAEEAAENTTATTTPPAAAENTTVTSGEVKEIKIANFVPSPADVSIKVGDTVKWTNNMDNVKLTIGIYPPKEGGTTYVYTPLNDLKTAVLMPGESYQYTFNQTNKFKWASLFKADKVFGYITVTK